MNGGAGLQQGGGGGDGEYLVHDGRAGLLNLTAVNATTWIAAGAPAMNGLDGSWPPTGPAAAAVTHVVDGKDWPGVDWPASILSPNRSAAGGGDSVVADRCATYMRVVAGIMLRSLRKLRLRHNAT